MTTAGFLASEDGFETATIAERMLRASAAGVIAVESHGRLAVATSVEAGKWPPWSRHERGPIVVCLAGRLYERRELREACHAEPDVGDAGLASAAFERWGAAAFERLRGRFAVITWEPRKNRLMLARDPVGAVPVFYRRMPNGLAFATSVACLAQPLPPLPQIDGEMFSAHVNMTAWPPERTCLEGINRLPPGHWLSACAGRVNVARHYTPRAAVLPGRPRDEDYAVALRTKMVSAIERDLPDTGDVGVFLSGGLDSSALACLAAPRLSSTGRALFAASSVLPAGYSGLETDESAYLQALEARWPNLVIDRVAASDATFVDDVEAIFARTWTPINGQHFMDRALTDALAGRRVQAVLSGMGGDSGASLRGPAAPAASWFGERRRRVFATLRGTSVDEPGAHQLRRLERGVGRAMEELTNVLGMRGLELLLPYKDVQLLEFLAGVPARVFTRTSMGRSLFRDAMAGVLPETIRLRIDKHPYVPDLRSRVAAQADRLAQWLAALRRDTAERDALEQYLDLPMIEAALTAIRQPGAPQVLEAGMLLHGLTAAAFLVWYKRLTEGGYPCHLTRRI